MNEAFAPVPLAWLAETGADAKTLNPSGGAIALGHPLGARGARLMTALVHHMRDNGIRYGLQTMCEGGGMANATILELLLPDSACTPVGEISTGKLTCWPMTVVDRSRVAGRSATCGRSFSSLKAAMLSLVVTPPSVPATSAM